MSRTGGCYCGGVKFHLTQEVSETGACHCGMCRKFSGGVYLGVQVPPDGLVFDSDETLTTYKSSAWAERGFCGRCGSSLFYRVTLAGPMQGVWHLGLGALDDGNGVALTGEIYIDRKPDGYHFAEKTHQMTQAEVEAMFAPPA